MVSVFNQCHLEGYGFAFHRELNSNLSLSVALDVLNGILFSSIDSPLQFRSALFLSCQLSPVKRLRRVKDKRSAVNTGSLLLRPIFLYLLTAIWKQTVSLVIKDKKEAVRTRRCCIYYFILFVNNCMLHMFEYCVCHFCCCLLRR